MSRGICGSAEGKISSCAAPCAHPALVGAMALWAEPWPNTTATRMSFTDVRGRHVASNLCKAALLNPLPPLGVAPELRADVLAAETAAARLQVVKRGHVGHVAELSRAVWERPQSLS